MSASNSQIAFSPLGRTVVVPADVAAPAGVQAPVFTSLATQDVGQFRVVNASPNVVHLGVGSTAALAQAAAAAAAAGSPATGIPLVAGAVEILRFAPGTFFSAICAAGASTVFVTPGQGL